MNQHAQLMARDISGPLKELIARLAQNDGSQTWLDALNKFLRKENPWIVNDLHELFHQHGWTTEQIKILFEGSELTHLRKRMFGTPVLELTIGEVFTKETVGQVWPARSTYHIRICNVLLSENVRTLGQLVRFTEKQLRWMPNMGQKSVDIIKAILATHGLSLGMVFG